MNINYRVLTNREDKSLHKVEFQDFFRKLYAQDLSDERWEHQFLNSPYEESPLFLAFSGGEIVGSALMIPQKMRIESDVLDYYLFTTSAIEEKSRPHGVYAEMLRLQKEYALNRNKKLILAFPNKVAYPVVKLFGGFKDLRKDELVKCKLVDVSTSLCDSFELDAQSASWRFEHKDYLFIPHGDRVLVGKEYQGALDILGSYRLNHTWVRQRPLTECDEDTSVTALRTMVSSSCDFETLMKVNVVYFPLEKGVELTQAKINLLMSDVF